MPILTYTDFVNNMGLVDRPLMSLNPAWLWARKAWIGMGNRPHGDNLAAGYVSRIYDQIGTTYPDHYSALISNPWQDVTGWVVVHPAAENTCTNAVVLIYDLQVQWFDKTDNTWKLVSTTAAIERVPTNLQWWTKNTYASLGNCDKVYPNRLNIPRFSNVNSSADRFAPSSDPAKYSILHNGMSRAPVDYTKVGGITVMCKARLEPISGSLNGVPSIMMQVGADYYPETGINNGQGLLVGANAIPAVGASQFKKLELTDQVFLFTTARINPNTYYELTSQYVTSFPAGTYPHAMTDAVFAANVPQFMNF